MRCPESVFAACLIAIGVPAASQDFGREATPEEVAHWDFDSRPDGTGLPEGSGTVAEGREIYEFQCASCHGDRGGGGLNDRLVGGHGTLDTDAPVKTVGSYWPYATTLHDYIQRAMPYYDPGILSPDEAYAVSAYILNLNGILDDDAVLDRASIASIEMPNRDGFIPEPEFAPLVPDQEE